MKDFAGEVSDTKWVERMLRNNVLLREEVERLTAEVARLRLRPKERKAIERAQTTLLVMCTSEEARSDTDTMWKMLKRLRGGK